MKYTVNIVKSRSCDDEGLEINGTNGVVVSDGVIKVFEQGTECEFIAYTFPADKYCCRVYEELL